MYNVPNFAENELNDKTGGHNYKDDVSKRGEHKLQNVQNRVKNVQNRVENVQNRVENVQIFWEDGPKLSVSAFSS